MEQGEQRESGRKENFDSGILLWLEELVQLVDGVLDALGVFPSLGLASRSLGVFILINHLLAWSISVIGVIYNWHKTTQASIGNKW